MAEYSYEEQWDNHQLRLKRDGEKQKLASDIYACNCGNIEHHEYRQVCPLCGKTTCRMCRKQHGEKWFYSNDPYNICFKDENMRIRKSIRGRRIDDVATGRSEWIEQFP